MKRSCVLDVHCKATEMEASFGIVFVEQLLNGEWSGVNMLHSQGPGSRDSGEAQTSLERCDC
jgi:hypothetical protein